MNKNELPWEFFDEHNDLQPANPTYVKLEQYLDIRCAILSSIDVTLHKILQCKDYDKVQAALDKVIPQMEQVLEWIEKKDAEFGIE